MLSIFLLEYLLPLSPPYIVITLFLYLISSLLPLFFPHFSHSFLLTFLLTSSFPYQFISPPTTPSFFLTSTTLSLSFTTPTLSITSLGSSSFLFCFLQRSLPPSFPHHYSKTIPLTITRHLPLTIISNHQQEQLSLSRLSSGLHERLIYHPFAKTVACDIVWSWGWGKKIFRHDEWNFFRVACCNYRLDYWFLCSPEFGLSYRVARKIQRPCYENWKEKIKCISCPLGAWKFQKRKRQTLLIFSEHNTKNNGKCKQTNFFLLLSLTHSLTLSVLLPFPSLSLPLLRYEPQKYSSQICTAVRPSSLLTLMTWVHAVGDVSLQHVLREVWDVCVGSEGWLLWSWGEGGTTCLKVYPVHVFVLNLINVCPILGASLKTFVQLTEP